MQALLPSVCVTLPSRSSFYSKSNPLYHSQGLPVFIYDEDDVCVHKILPFDSLQIHSEHMHIAP